MEKTRIIQEIKDLIGKAATEEALEKLTAFLGQAGHAYNQLERMALQAQALFQKTKNEQSLGIISSENAKLNFNQVNNSVLKILGYLETGQLQPLEESSTKSSSWKKALMIIGSIVILGFAFWILKDHIFPPEETVLLQEEKICPEFDLDAKLNIMVLPFKPYDNKPLNTHEAIKDNLIELNDKYQINTSTKTTEIDPFNQERYPSSSKDAGKMAYECDAQLVIWGTTEQKQNETIVSMRYVFRNLAGKFAHTKLKLNENTEVDTVSSLSSIANNGVLTENITENIKILFGLIAQNSGENEAAIELLSETEPKDSNTIAMTQMALADCYIATGQEDKAIDAYDKVLENQPDDTLALNNRALLNFKKGAYHKATEDLDRQLLINENDSDARLARGIIHLKNNRLSKAKTDLKEVQKEKPEDKRVQSQIKELRSREIIEIRKKRSAEAKLREEPANVEAMTELTESSKNLGDFDNAISTAKELLKKDPNNEMAIKSIIESYMEKKDFESVKKWRTKAATLNIMIDPIITRPKFLESINKPKPAIDSQKQ